MSHPAENTPANPRRLRLYLGAFLLAAAPASFLVWAAIEHFQDTADRAH